MDVFSTELGIRLSFVKTSEFRGGGGDPPNPPRYATDQQYVGVRFRNFVLQSRKLLIKITKRFHTNAQRFRCITSLHAMQNGEA
jgi:hypothetical protein